MLNKYKFLTVHLEKAIRDLVETARAPVWDGAGDDRRPETRQQWIQWKEELYARARRVKEEMDA